MIGKEFRFLTLNFKHIYFGFEKTLLIKIRTIRIKQYTFANLKQVYLFLCHKIRVFWRRAIKSLKAFFTLSCFMLAKVYCLIRMVLILINSVFSKPRYLYLKNEIIFLPTQKIYYYYIGVLGRIFDKGY